MAFMFSWSGVNIPVFSTFRLRWKEAVHHHFNFQCMHIIHMNTQQIELLTDRETFLLPVNVSHVELFHEFY